MSEEVVCEGCGLAFELPPTEPPGHCPPAEPQTSRQENPLDCWLAGDPIRARKVSDWQRFRQWSRQRPVRARVVATLGLATLLVALSSTVMLFGESMARRQTERALGLLEQDQGRTQRRLQTAEKLVRQHQGETHRAAEACQTTLGKLHETEGHLDDLQQRYNSIAQGRQEIESAARLALARSMAAESSRRLAAQPTESLLLAERAMSYLNAEGKPTDLRLQQTLRDAAALTGDQALRGHSGPVEAIAVSRNGRWLLTGSVDKTVQLRDLHGPASDESPQVLRGHQSPVRLAKISPDSRWAITSDDNGQVILWDLRSPDLVASMRVLQAHQGRVHALAVSSDSRWLAVAGTGAFEEEDNSVRLWDLKGLSTPGGAELDLAGAASDANRTASEPSHVLRGHLGPVLAVAITPDCRRVVTASADETVRLFNLASHCPAASQVVLRQHAGPVACIAISPDGRWMVTGSHDQTARLWDLTTPQPGTRSSVLSGHEGTVHSVAINSTGRWVATASHDHSVRLWNMNAVDPIATCVVLIGHQADVGPILFSPDGHRLITGSDDGTARVWDMEAADPAANPVFLRGHCGPVAALAITPDGRKVLTGCREVDGRTDCLVRLWDLPIDRVLKNTRPLIAQRMNALEQEQVLLETARRSDKEGPGEEIQ